MGCKDIGPFILSRLSTPECVRAFSQPKETEKGPSFGMEGDDISGIPRIGPIPKTEIHPYAVRKGNAITTVSEATLSPHWKRPFLTGRDPSFQCYQWKSTLCGTRSSL